MRACDNAISIRLLSFVRSFSWMNFSSISMVAWISSMYWQTAGINLDGIHVRGSGVLVFSKIGKVTPAWYWHHTRTILNYFPTISCELLQYFKKCKQYTAPSAALRGTMPPPPNSDGPCNARSHVLRLYPTLNILRACLLYRFHGVACRLKMIVPACIELLVCKSWNKISLHQFVMRCF